jgi:type III restriction enzyme
MKFELKSYQETAATTVLSRLRKGSRDFAEDNDYTSVSLSAPTGAGKTVIAAAVIEQILYGDADGVVEADPDAVILWLTDDPSLNEQTKKKILEASDKIQPSQLETIDDRLKQPELARGKVYFLNIQKLGKKSNLTKHSDKRLHTIWEIIANTVTNNGAHYYLVIDEAHRGAGSSMQNRQTLAQRLVSDADHVVPPAPVVWGISATPDRFDKAMAASTPDRATRSVKVPVEEVRESGLIKDVLSISHRGEDQEMTATLVRAAARSLKEFDDEWTAYTDSEEEAPVRPALVIQIPPNYADKDVAEILNICENEWPALTGNAIAHCLESHSAQQYGSHTVKYVAPQDIYDKEHIRLVLFKEALTTGWDCPRAEVMLSLRTAQDDTYIAQLIGRMVRTPLARRIVSNEALNRVRLFLPNFNTEAVEAVAAKLESDPDAGGTTRVEVNSVDAYKNTTIDDEVFTTFAGLSSYEVPGPVHRSQVARLHKLSALLIGDEILPDAIALGDAYLVGVLESERTRLDTEGKFAGMVADVETADVAVFDYSIHVASEKDESSSPDDSETDEGNVEIVGITTDSGDLSLMYKVAGRRFRDGLAHEYWAHRVTGEGDDADAARAATVALSSDPAVIEKVETSAEDRVQQWLKDYGSSIAALSEDRKAKYSEVRQMAKSPEQVNPALASKISMSADDPKRTQHIYSDSEGSFFAKLGSWEEEVLTVEQGKSDSFVAWYRNPTGGQRALRIPYKDGKVWKKMYPDFVVFHRDDEGEIRPSIVDPHGHHLADGAVKLRGLAEYATKHGDEYARIEAVIKTGAGEFMFIDMKDQTVRESLENVNGKDEIETVFTSNGSLYKQP